MREPRAHQHEALNLSIDQPAWFLDMEQRTGKTLIVTKTAAKHAHEGNIAGVLIMSWPSGTQHVWAEEWPKDWDGPPHNFVAWRSGKTKKEDLVNLLTAPEFLVVAMNCEALLTDLGWWFVGRFLKLRRLLVTVDEDWAKNPNAARTKRLLAIGRHPHAVLRRFLSGTAAAEGALDLFAPFQFLDPNIIGHRSFFTFRRRYTVMTTGYAAGGREFQTQAIDEQGRKLYQNLDELQAKIASYRFRVKRADISDAPAKTYQSRYFELTPKQRGVYDRLENEFVADLRVGEMPVSLMITRLLRLQAVSRNWYPAAKIGTICEACGGTGIVSTEECLRCQGLGMVVETTALERIDPDRNPVAEALTEELRVSSGPAIVWARFHVDVDDALAAAKDLGRRAVAYDGRVNSKGRADAYSGFQEGRYDCIVATTGSGLSRGHDLSRAEILIYYSNSYVLRDRLQSEDRAETLTRSISTGIIDLVGVDTRDGPIIEALRAKLDVSNYILGDTRDQDAVDGKALTAGTIMGEGR